MTAAAAANSNGSRVTAAVGDSTEASAASSITLTKTPNANSGTPNDHSLTANTPPTTTTTESQSQPSPPQHLSIDSFIRRINRNPIVWSPRGLLDETGEVIDWEEDEEKEYMMEERLQEEEEQEALSRLQRSRFQLPNWGARNAANMKGNGSGSPQLHRASSSVLESLSQQHAASLKQKSNNGASTGTGAQSSSTSAAMHKNPTTRNLLTWSEVLENPRQLLKMEMYLFQYKLRHAIRSDQSHIVELMFQLMRERQEAKNQRKRKLQEFSNRGKSSRSHLSVLSDNGDDALSSASDERSGFDPMSPNSSRRGFKKHTPSSSRLNTASNTTAGIPHANQYFEIQLDLLPDEPCPLHVACEAGYYSIVQLALRYYNVNTVDPVTRKLPIHIAIENQHKHIVLLLAKCGANVSYHNDLVASPLTTAVSVEDESIVEVLLFQFKANPNSDFVDIRNSPMYECCKKRNVMLFEILRKAGCNVDATGGFLKQTVLHQLIRDQDLEGVRMILEKKKYRADIFLEDRNGYSSLHIAASNADFPEMIRLLVKFGAQPDILSNAVGRVATPLSLAVANGFCKNAQALVVLGADIDQPMNNEKLVTEKRTVLSYAVELENEDIVALFLKHGADLETPFTRTPLYLACKIGNVAITKLLLDAGANTEVVDAKHQYSPLMVATKRGHDKVVRLLLKYHCNVNHLSSEHETALHVAARIGNKRIIMDLLKFNIDASIKNDYRQTALHISCEQKHFEIVEILLRHNAEHGSGRSGSNSMNSGYQSMAHTSRTRTATTAKSHRNKKKLTSSSRHHKAPQSPQKLMHQVRNLITPVRKTRERPNWKGTSWRVNQTTADEFRLPEISTRR